MDFSEKQAYADGQSPGAQRPTPPRQDRGHLRGSLLELPSQFNARVNRLAHALSGLGMAKGDKLAVLALNGHEYLEIYHATAKLGVWMVPINHRLKPQDIAYRISHSQASGLVLGPEFVLLYDSLPAEARRAVGDCLLILGEGPAVNGSHSYEELLATSSEGEPEGGSGPRGHSFHRLHRGHHRAQQRARSPPTGPSWPGYLYKVLDYGLGQGESGP